jgi:hypothetical protein
VVQPGEALLGVAVEQADQVREAEVEGEACRDGNGDGVGEVVTVEFTYGPEELSAHAPRQVVSRGRPAFLSPVPEPGSPCPASSRISLSWSEVPGSAKNTTNRCFWLCSSGIDS